MKFAYIELDAQNHEVREKSIKLFTIFGDVFAPLCKVEFNGDRSIAAVPVWIFHNASLNPCQMVSGFIGERR